ncbi:MAG: DUF523 and DUF1722 domain-containing protein [Thermoguttaceae bacterium]|nr:DUF523 and DUF1722 domain-containing protein [Thermoguttaceae bacterium]MDW8077713.1 DUF523 and DUF1722 domain-containing protein [Thermoguttaceae bacterium]
MVDKGATSGLDLADPIRIGISSCLLGEPVRYNGMHARDLYILGTLGKFFEFVPVCPEVEIGLGVPRPTLRLERHDRDAVRLIMPSTGDDYTEKMESWARKRLAELVEQDLCGYILKKNSPSCGLRVRTVRQDGKPGPAAPGIFAAALMEAMPRLPVIEEGRLHDPHLREHWVERVFAYYRLKQLWRPNWTVGKLVAFHTAHKIQLLAHSPQKAQDLGRLIARAKELPRSELKAQYEELFLQALEVPTTRGKHANVMHHMLGFFSDKLDRESRQEVLATIEDFRKGQVPLVVPLVLIRHYVRVFDVEYLKGQVYLEPYPAELALRSQIF